MYKYLLIAMILSLNVLLPSFGQSLDNTYRMTYLGEPASMDPHKVSGTWENAIMTQLYLGLFTNDAQENTIPGTVQSYRVSEDGLTYTFLLREDARWSDGQPVTAHDYVYAWKRLASPQTASPYNTMLNVITGMAEYAIDEKTEIGAKALDDKTLEVTLKHPAPYFTELLTHYASYAVPQHVIEKQGTQWTKPEHIVSNGAYQLVEWKPNTHIKMRKNPHFYDADQVSIEHIIYLPGEDRTTWLKRFRAGEIDYVDDIPEEQLTTIRKELGDQLIIADFLGTYFYSINNKKPPFDDVRVRQALNMIIDRETITDKVLKSGWKAAYSFVPKGIHNYQNGPAEFRWRDLPQTEKNKIAQQLLAEAGFTKENPLKFTLAYNTSENHKRIAIAMAQMLQRNNIHVKLFNQEVTPHYDALKQKNYDVARAGWIADYSDPQTFLYLFETKTGQQNYANYHHPEFDQLMEKANQLQSIEERAVLLKQAEQMILDDAAVIPMMYYVKYHLVNSRVQNFYPFKKGANPVRWLTLSPQP